MCRTYFIGALDGGTLGENGYGIHLNYLVNSHNTSNRDGYAAYGPGYEIRTLSYPHILEEISRNRDKIKNSNFIAGHARASTNTICENFVHGWVFNGYRCYHNGIIHMDTKHSENDSLNFFTEVFRRKKKGLVGEITRTVKNRVTSGWGVFMFVGEGTKYFVCFNKGLNVHVINKELLVLNSGDDIHRFHNMLKFKFEHKKKFWGLDFNKTVERKYPSQVDITEDLQVTLNDSIVVVDRCNRIVKVIPLERKNEYYYSYNDGSKYGQRVISDYRKEKDKVDLSTGVDKEFWSGYDYDKNQDRNRYGWGSEGYYD